MRMAEALPPRLGLRLCVHSMVALSIPGAAQMFPILADLLNSILNIDGKYGRGSGEGASIWVVYKKWRIKGDK